MTIQDEWNLRNIKRGVRSLASLGFPSTARSALAPTSLAVLCAVMLNACHENGTAIHSKAFWSGIEPVAVASGRANRGPWRMNESDFDYVDDASVAITDDAHVGIAWVDQARKDVLLQTYTPQGRALFAKPVNLSRSPATFSWAPKLAIDRAEPWRVYALWQEIVFSGGNHGGEIFFARSNDGGATFEAPVNLSNSVAGDGKGQLTAEMWDNGSLDLAVAGNGRLYAAWTEYEGRLLVSRSKNNGASFSEPVHIAGDAGRPARAPALAADRGGTVHLAWSAGGLGSGKIHVAAAPNGQLFSVARLVPSNGHADAPDIAADSQGTLHLVFSESPATARQQYRIRYARLDTRTGLFSEPQTLAGPESGLDSVNFPNLAVDATGRVFITWQRFPNRRRHSLGLGFTMSPDGGRHFATPEIVPHSDNPGLGMNGSLQGSFVARLAANPSGSLGLANTTFAPGDSSYIWLWRKPAPAQ